MPLRSAKKFSAGAVLIFINFLSLRQAVTPEIARRLGRLAADEDAAFAVSPDGESITHVRADLPGHGTIVFGAGKFLMLTSHSDADLLTSTDGMQWDRVAVDGAAKLRWLVWTGREFLVEANKTIYRSADGDVWTKSEVVAPRGTVKWTDGTRFITSSWPGKMGFSPDGKAWQDSPPLSANGINRVVLGVRPE